MINEIRSQKDPFKQKLLIWFFYPLIVGLILTFISPVAEHIINPYLNSDKRVLAKELKAEINFYVKDKEVLNDFRYVSADILNVRASASTKSEVIGNLYFSSIVLVIDKQKNWTLIEWNNPETGAKITGWVFTRYVKKFN